MLGYIGFLMLVIGAAGVDGNRMILAGIMALTGLGLIAIDEKRKSFAPSRPK